MMTNLLYCVQKDTSALHAIDNDDHLNVMQLLIEYGADFDVQTKVCVVLYGRLLFMS
jgi:hypothetical protein